MTHTRNHKVYTITMPEDEHDEAVSKLPHGQIRTFSALVREALAYFPPKKRK